MGSPLPYGAALAKVPLGWKGPPGPSPWTQASLEVYSASWHRHSCHLHALRGLAPVLPVQRSVTRGKKSLKPGLSTNTWDHFLERTGRMGRIRARPCQPAARPAPEDTEVITCGRGSDAAGQGALGRETPPHSASPPGPELGPFSGPGRAARRLCDAGGAPSSLCLSVHICKARGVRPRPDECADRVT